MCESTDDLITVGSYVIIKKQNFRKIYKVTANGNMLLGKDQVNMREIIGKRFWSTFEMIPEKNGKRTFSLKESTDPESWDDLLTTLPSGSDNRSITDDGTSQKLSKEEILELRESGKTGKEIVGSLIENNKSFHVKTEYSQEKYIKKKERKYFRYLTVCKPKIGLLHDVYFKLDRNKIANLRMDALAQLLSYSDVQSDGLYLLYDSGSQGLPAAAMLNRIGANTEGHLINLHPGNVPQTLLVQAMNFPKDQLGRLINVNIYSFLRLHYQGEEAVLEHVNVSRRTQNNSATPVRKDETTSADCVGDQSVQDKTKDKERLDDAKLKLGDAVTSETQGNCGNLLKRKLDDSTEAGLAKKPKWFFETQRALGLLESSKARGLAVVAREHPLNIVNGLLPFLGASRPFVIFHVHREPLQETYMALKQWQNVINLRLFSNFLRSYQVLPDRTHPDITTSDTGGYFLTGYSVQ